MVIAASECPISDTPCGVIGADRMSGKGHQSPGLEPNALLSSVKVGALSGESRLDSIFYVSTIGAPLATQPPAEKTAQLPS